MEKKDTTKKSQGSLDVYVVNPGVLLQDNKDVKTVRVECLDYMNIQKNGFTKEICHPTMSYGFLDGKWPSKTNVWCRHCCHPFDTTPVPIPNRYDEDTGVYYVYGMFCSVNCAKQYILEREPLITTNRMLLFREMCSRVFGVKKTVKPAPPAEVLSVFMGDKGLSIQQFREGFLTPMRIVADQSPFVHSPKAICVWDEYRKEKTGNEIIQDLIEESKEEKAFDTVTENLTHTPLFDAFLGRDLPTSCEDVNGCSSQSGKTEEELVTPLPQPKVSTRKKKGLSGDEAKAKAIRLQAMKLQAKAQKEELRRKKKEEKRKKEMLKLQKKLEREEKKRQNRLDKEKKKLDKELLKKQKILEKIERDKKDEQLRQSEKRRSGALSAFVQYKN